MNKKREYDYIIVGGGLYGLVWNYLLNQAGKRTLIIEKRGEIGGNILDKDIDGINVHLYGAHIFHTSDEGVWRFVNKFTEFNNYINSPISQIGDCLYNLPFNMNTFTQLWRGELKSPKEVMEKINNEKLEYVKLLNGGPKNLKEMACSLVGETIFKNFIKEYTEKQWGRKCEELPPEIIKRIPIRYTFNNNYFNDKYQGIPIGGYKEIINKLSKGADIITNIDFNQDKDYFLQKGEKCIYTSSIDGFYDYCYGKLEYRGLNFKTEKVENCSNFQGVAVMNFPEKKYPYTRRIEHKHFSSILEEDINKLDYTFITYEYPLESNKINEPYYPINNEKNMNIYNQYKLLSEKEPNIIFGGRLGEYKYYDMDKIIKKAFQDYDRKK